MPVARKRPCCIYHRWFRPDNRVGSRQRACSRPACQSLRRRKKQAAWRGRNPDYFSGRRIQARGVCDEPPEPLRLPSPLHRLPWDIAQSIAGLESVVLRRQHRRHYSGKLQLDDHRKVFCSKPDDRLAYRILCSTAHFCVPRKALLFGPDSCDESRTNFVLQTRRQISVPHSVLR